MGRTLERASIKRQADEARETALNLNAILDESLFHLDKLVQSRGNGNGKKRAFKLKKQK